MHETLPQDTFVKKNSSKNPILQNEIYNKKGTKRFYRY